MNFINAVENNSSYKDVCTIGIANNGSRTNSDVISKLDGLQCKENTLDEWNWHSDEYKDKFIKARKCLQRRITTMKRFPTNTNELKQSRRRHLFPIQVAYTYGRDCLRKIGTNKDINRFKTSVSNLFESVAKSQPNIKDLVGRDFEETISKHSQLKDIFNKEYYNPEQWALINKERSIGYEALSNEEKELYNSIVGTQYKQIIRQINENKSVNNTSNLENTSKQIQRRRQTKKKKKKNSTVINIPNTNFDIVLKNKGPALDEIMSSAISLETNVLYKKRLEYMYKDYYITINNLVNIFIEMKSAYILLDFDNKNKYKDDIYRLIDFTLKTLTDLQNAVNKEKQLRNNYENKLKILLQTHKNSKVADTKYRNNILLDTFKEQSNNITAQEDYITLISQLEKHNKYIRGYNTIYLKFIDTIRKATDLKTTINLKKYNNSTPIGTIFLKRYEDTKKDIQLAFINFLNISPKLLDLILMEIEMQQKLYLNVVSFYNYLKDELPNNISK